MGKPPKTPSSASLVTALLPWFSTSARDLPWRRTRDPYAIWVSEIMLQQTQVKTVIPYWERWMRELPTIQSLARASAQKIHKLWEGLGYYTRVRNLQNAARQIVAEHNGVFPENFDAILALPGIGPYTAGAIASIAFNQPRPILDGNVIRVLTRLFAIPGDPRDKKINKQLWSLATHLVQTAALTQHATRNTLPCSHLNQSLMELGALLCTPRDPQCPRCPVRAHCAAHRAHRATEFPHLAPRAAVTARHFVAFVIEHRGRFLVRQRPAGQVNAHLWEFPNTEAPRAMTLAEAQATLSTLLPAQTKPVPIVAVRKDIRHTITRYRITLQTFHAKLPPSTSRRSMPSSPPSHNSHLSSILYPLSSSSSSRWLPLPKLDPLPFTSAHRKILNQLRK